MGLDPAKSSGYASIRYRWRSFAAVWTGATTMRRGRLSARVIATSAAGPPLIPPLPPPGPAARGARPLTSDGKTRPRQVGNRIADMHRHPLPIALAPYRLMKPSVKRRASTFAEEPYRFSQRAGVAGSLHVCSGSRRRRLFACPLRRCRNRARRRPRSCRGSRRATRRGPIRPRSCRRHCGRS
jgi:hypothetical protein